MILIELVGGASPRFRLEFHPRFTVVAGLEPEQRKELAASLNALLRGEERHMSLSVDVGGVPQDFTDDLVRLLGLDHLNINNIVAPADLPGAVVPGSAAPASASASEIVSSDQAGIGRSDNIALQQSYGELAAAQEAVTDLEGRIQRAGTPPPQVDDAELTEARRLEAEARQRMAAIKARLEEIGVIKDEPTPEEQLTRLTEITKAVEERINALKMALEDVPVDVEAVRAARKEAESAPAILQERSARTAALAQLAGQWTRVTQDLARLAKQPRPPQWLILQTKDELDEAQARVKAFTYQMQEGIDVRAQLDRSSRQLADAQAAWDEIEHGIEGQIAVLEEERDNLYGRVRRIFGDDIDNDGVVDALEEEHRQTQSAPHPTQNLVDALSAAGVEANVDDAIVKADSWFAEREKSQASHGENQKALAAAMLDLRDLQQQTGELQAKVNDANSSALEFADEKSELEEAITAHEVASDRLAELEAIKQLSNEYDLEALPKLAEQLGEARVAREAAQRKVDYFSAGEGERVVKSAGFAAVPLPVDEPAALPWWEGGRPGIAGLREVDMSNVSYSDVDVYLLSRVAGLRLVARGESIPVVIDSVFEGMPHNLTAKTLEALAKVSPIVQVVYLAGHDMAEKWAKKQDIYKAAVVRLELA